MLGEVARARSRGRLREGVALLLQVIGKQENMPFAPQALPFHLSPCLPRCNPSKEAGLPADHCFPETHAHGTLWLLQHSRPWGLASPGMSDKLLGTVPHLDTVQVLQQLL